MSSFELPDPLVPRRATATANQRLRAARVLVINGPRQSGKTAVLGLLNQQHGGTYVSLDLMADLRSARTDPSGFVTGFERPLFIDEVQRGGDPLVLAVKYEADRTNQRGNFVLAGSTRFLTEPRLSESLAGRVRFVDLWPFSQGEIDRTADGFVDVILSNPDQVAKHQPPALTRGQLFERVCRGGFPDAVLAETQRDRRGFFADYARTLTSRDVTELAAVEHSASLRTFLNLLAARTASELNVASLAADLGLAESTVRRYIPLFETIYVHYLVPAWSRKLTAKVVHRPKIHMVDTGLAAHLLGVSPTGLARPNAVHAGHLLETFVSGELARQLTWSETEATLYHWRDRSGREVDLILETPDGRVVGIEVKAAVDVHDRDFSGLRTLKERLGDLFVAGIVIHCGDRPRPFGPKLWSLPVASLWTTP